jgi:ketosteroid isomerase-like protein
MRQVSLAQVPEVLGPAFEQGDVQSEGKVQERANVELLGRMFHAIAHGRFDELRHLLAYDVVFEIAAPADVPWARRALGPEEVADAIAANFRSLRGQRSEPLALVSQGDTVMVMARETGRWAETGAPYEVMLAQQYTFRDGRLAVFRSVVADTGAPAAALR